MSHFPSCFFNQKNRKKMGNIFLTNTCNDTQILHNILIINILQITIENIHNIGFW